jgi:hypothetical protein
MGEEGKDKKKDQEGPKLTRKDYLALAIAALETFLLPLVVLIVVLVVLALVFTARL